MSKFSIFFLFKQKTAYEMRISDWSSDVCSSDLLGKLVRDLARLHGIHTHARNELLLRSGGNFRKESEHRCYELARALRIDDHRGELMRVDARPIRGVDGR